MRNNFLFNKLNYIKILFKLDNPPKQACYVYLMSTYIMYYTIISPTTMMYWQLSWQFCGSFGWIVVFSQLLMKICDLILLRYVTIDSGRRPISLLFLPFLLNSNFIPSYIFWIDVPSGRESIFGQSSSFNSPLTRLDIYEMSYSIML